MTEPTSGACNVPEDNLHCSNDFLQHLLRNENDSDPHLADLVPSLQRNISSRTLPSAIRAASIRLTFRYQQHQFTDEVEHILHSILREPPGSNPWAVEVAAVECLAAQLETTSTSRAYILSRTSDRFHKELNHSAFLAVNSWNQAAKEDGASAVAQFLSMKDTSFTVVGLCAVAGMHFGFGLNQPIFEILFDHLRNVERSCEAWMRQYCEDALIGLGRSVSIQAVHDLLVKEGIDGMRVVRVLICKGMLLKGKNALRVADFESVCLVVETLCTWVCHVAGVCESWLDVAEEGEQRKALVVACKNMSSRALHALGILHAILDEWGDYIFQAFEENRTGAGDAYRSIAMAACSWIYADPYGTKAARQAGMGVECRREKDALPWASTECTKAATELLKQLEKVCVPRKHNASLPECYVRHILGNSGMETLRQRLARGAWRGKGWLYLCAVLQCVDMMDLREFEESESDLIGHLVPILLPLIDDVNGKCVRMGLCALQRVLEEVTPTAFRRHGELVLNSIDTALATREVATMELTLLCLRRALKMMEPMLRCENACPMHHRFMKKSLMYLKLLQDECLRSELLSFVDTLIQRIGINAAAYLQETLPVLEQLVSSGGVANQRVRMRAIEVLGTLVKQCWVVCKPYHDQIIAIFLRAHIMASVSSEIAQDKPGTKEVNSELDSLANTVELIAGLVSKETLLEKMRQIESATGQTHFNLLRSQS